MELMLATSVISQSLVALFFLDGACLTVAIDGMSTVADLAAVATCRLPHLPSMGVALFEVIQNIEDTRQWRLLTAEQIVLDILRGWHVSGQPYVKIVVPMNAQPFSDGIPGGHNTGSNIGGTISTYNATAAALALGRTGAQGGLRGPELLPAALLPNSRWLQPTSSVFLAAADINDADVVGMEEGDSGSWGKTTPPPSPSRQSRGAATPERVGSAKLDSNTNIGGGGLGASIVGAGVGTLLASTGSSDNEPNHTPLVDGPSVEALCRVLASKNAEVASLLSELEATRQKLAAAEARRDTMHAVFSCRDRGDRRDRENSGSRVENESVVSEDGSVHGSNTGTSPKPTRSGSGSGTGTGTGRMGKRASFSWAVKEVMGRGKVKEEEGAGGDTGNIGSVGTGSVGSGPCQYSNNRQRSSAVRSTVPGPALFLDSQSAGGNTGNMGGAGGYGRAGSIGSIVSPGFIVSPRSDSPDFVRPNVYSPNDREGT
eukprot:CAMPEP_0173204946 /NCGR_PEP_ID=MMETSP1141-20130122/20442_1 /TAXON_ID=483371 /ORGANISM="non described non described, Strain CCMP2298" /LENGTH=485 /DNA_ID=CAMNT_0014130741 /DNA_START=33 /DNA_END=1486 /DNA_ORIENTATION=-